MPEAKYDVIVIGSGPAGENLAGRTAKGGLRTAIVESELVGGECSYWACIPSKALLRPVAALAEVRAVPGSREAVTGTIDVNAVLARRDRLVGDWKDDSQVKWLNGVHIDLHRGHGRLSGPRRVTVTGADGRTTDLAARHVVAICTGSDTAMPAIPGLAGARPWTSREATSARHAPVSLAILGGGVVACELATAWCGLGTRDVTIIQRGSRLLPALEEFAGLAVRESLERRGVRVVTGATATRVERDAHGVRLTLTDGATVNAAELLVATGRAPRTGDLGIEHAGLEPGAWIDVDDSMRATAVADGWLYAVGDVNHVALLTHMGKYQARVAGDAIVARVRGDAAAERPAAWSAYAATANAAAVPQVVFTDPEVAVVGLDEARARARGLRVRTVEFGLGHVSGGALHAEHYAGTARITVDADRHVIVGMMLVGPGVGELIHAATIAIVGEVPLERLWHAVPAFPTISEVWLRLLEAWGL